MIRAGVVAAVLAAGKVGVDAPPTKPKVAPAPVVNEPSHRTDVLATVGWLGVAAGVGLAATGTVFFTAGQGEIDASTCGDEPWCAPTATERARRKDHGDSMKRIGVISWIAGGALLVGGVVAIVLSDGEDDDDLPAARGVQLEAVAPTLLPDGSPGLSAALSF